MRSPRILVPTIIALSGWLLWPQQGQAISIVPPSLEFGVQPGQTVKTSIKLYNEEDRAYALFSSVSNFTAYGEEGEPTFDFAEQRSDLAGWIDVGAGPYTLKPGDRIEVPIEINVPPEAEPGGHYASVFFGTEPSPKQEGGGQVAVRSLVGTLIILRVEGQVQESGSILEFKPTGSKSKSRLPVDLLLRIRNDGNVHFRPKGTVIVRNIFGGESARLTANDTNGAVLPDSVRRFEVTWQKPDSKDQSGNFFSEFGAEWRNFGFGPYTATATVMYGQSDLTLQATTQFTIIPWRVLLMVLVVLVILILILTVGLKRYNAAVIRHAQQKPPTAGK
ncbi:MAG: hypothetical protein HYY50_04515 [Candidatus Kerfeldbacteria bacterium]|nr:hypothetical protein [Candidatus Kerfeldbacteria bacterium]